MLVAGLGNPGPAYRSSRHNIGFRVAEEFARKAGVSRFQARWRGIAGSAMVDGLKVCVLKPLTFMNCSGGSVSIALRELGLGPGDLIVIHDDLDLEFGRIRIRSRGSSGGHRGVQSIIDTLGTSEFGRIRLGIGRPEEGVDPVDYVLGDFSRQENETLGGMVSEAANAVFAIIHDGYERAMSRYSS